MPMHETMTQTSAKFSMAGVAYLPLPLGSIRIGHSQKLPGGRVHLIKDDEFKVTQPLRDEAGDWVRDPLDAALRANLPGEQGVAQRKLREIPIRVAVNDPALIARAQLQAFDRATGQVMCSSKGNGVAHRWSAGSGTTEVSCVGCDRCSFANSGNVECKFFGRLSVQLEGQSDELGTYTLRSTSYNTMRTVESKLWQFWAILGKKLRGVPFKLQLRPVQTQASNWETFYVVDLVLNGCTLTEAKDHAEKQQALDANAKLDIEAFESAIASGLNNGGFYGNDIHDGFDHTEFVEASQFASSLQTTQQSSVTQVELPSTSEHLTSAGAAEVQLKDVIAAPADRRFVVTPGRPADATNAVFVKGFAPRTQRTSDTSTSDESAPRSVKLGPITAKDVVDF